LANCELGLVLSHYQRGDLTGYSRGQTAQGIGGCEGTLISSNLRSSPGNQVFDWQLQKGKK
jgi:hypothetical protein